MPLKHFVLTRIGLGIFSEQWYEQMVALFLAVTASSLARQTSQDFHWLIVADAGMPAPARGQLDELSARHPNFHVVPTDVTRMTHMRLGGHDWVYDPCHDYILGRGLVEDPSEYVVTSMIDADDAWANDYVALTNMYFESQLKSVLAEEGKRGPHLRHSNGRVLTWNKGLTWFLNTDSIEPMAYAWHSMAVSMLARLSAGLSSLSTRHAAWPEAAKIAEFPVQEMSGSHPMWLYVRHDRTDLWWNAPPGQKSAANIAGVLEKGFGVDMAAVDAWRARYVDPGRNRHEGSDPADQYGRLFRLTGLNRQIAALEARLEADPSVADLLARQRQAREDLVKVVIEEGRKR